MSGFLEGLPEIRRRLEEPTEYARVQAELAGWHEQGIGVVSIFDDHYPAILRTIYEPPWLLFYKGSDSALLLCQPMVAVVGARSARSASIEMATELSLALSDAGACVVSGLAIGIDAAAHRGTLRSRRPAGTIAVLGNGLQNIYPAANFTLGQEILSSGGMLLSQFEPGEKPFPKNFLARNRIIAGLCKAVIVVQAAERSGSLVTARFALEEGRDVLALPGAVGDESFRGSNRLIKEGAYLLSELEEIFEFLPELRASRSPGNSSRAHDISPVQRQILTVVSNSQPLHYDRLPGKLRRLPNVSIEILELEMAGLIERLPGNYLSLKGKW